VTSGKHFNTFWNDSGIKKVRGDIANAHSQERILQTEDRATRKMTDKEDHENFKYSLDFGTVIEQ